MKTIGILNIIYGSLQTLGAVIFILYSLIAGLILKFVANFMDYAVLSEIQTNAGIITTCFGLFAASGINFIVSGTRVLSLNKKGDSGTKISAYINFGSYTVIAGLTMFGIYDYMPEEEHVEVAKTILNSFLISLGFISLIYPAYLMYYFYVRE